MIKNLAAIFALSAASLNLQAQETAPADTAKTENVVVQDQAATKLPFFKTKKHDGLFEFMAGVDGAYLQTDRLGAGAGKAGLQSARLGLLTMGVSGNDHLSFNLLPIGPAKEAQRFGSASTVLGAGATFSLSSFHLDPVVGYGFSKGFVYGAAAGADIGPIDVDGSVLFGTKANQSSISSPYQYYLQAAIPSPLKYEANPVPASVRKIHQLTAGVRSYTQEKDQDIAVPGAPLNIDLSMHTSTRHTRLFVENEVTAAFLGSAEKGAAVSLVTGLYYQKKTELMSFAGQATEPQKTAGFGMEIGAMFDFQKSAAKGGGSSKYRAGLVAGSYSKQPYVQVQLRRNLHVKR